MIKTLTHTKWHLNGEGNPATGKEVIVKFSPATGVKEFQVFAVRMGKNLQPDMRIDITESEAQDANFDQHVEHWAPWSEKYRETQASHGDQFWHMAEAMVKRQVRTMRH